MLSALEPSRSPMDEVQVHGKVTSALWLTGGGKAEALQPAELPARGSYRLGEAKLVCLPSCWE